jgi:energy-coupling factor transporter ATP-binding protein EcfA2
MTENDATRQNQIGQNFQGILGNISGGTIYQQYFVDTKKEIDIHRQEFIPGSPYRGLEKFESENRDKFFGRSQWVDTLSQYLIENNLLLLLGGSGSGKSSLVRAGLIPTLADVWGSEKCINLTFVPDKNPFISLHACLLQKGKRQTEAEIALREEADTLTQVVKDLRKDFYWIIFIDQFEELFTITQKESEPRCMKFISSLVHLIKEQNSFVKIILAMRVDFLGRLSHYPELTNETDSHTRLLTEMKRDELRWAIAEPAARNGVTFQERLVEQIINDFLGRVGSLPLLQFTLNLLWTNQKLDETHRMLQQSTYKSIGGIDGALQQQASKIYAEIAKKYGEENTRQIFIKIFIDLIDVIGDKFVSRRTVQSNFRDGGVKEKILDELIENRLLVGGGQINGEEERGTVEVAHEALLESWSIIQNLLKEKKELISLKSQLASDIQRWHLLSKSEDILEKRKATEELWSGSKLEKIKEFQREEYFVGWSEVEKSFIEASIQKREVILIKERLHTSSERWDALRETSPSKAENELWSGLELENLLRLKREKKLDLYFGGLSAIEDNFINACVGLLNSLKVFSTQPSDLIQKRDFIHNSPYKGLMSFEISDEDRFFGRERLVHELIQNLRNKNFVLLLGASGSGKSSVIRAGLIPTLRKSLATTNFFTFTFVPNRDPFESFYSSLIYHGFKQTDAQIARRGEPNSLSQAIDNLKKEDEQWLIFIDQFEELFTISELDRRDRFIKSLVHLIESLRVSKQSAVQVVIAMRADFLDRLSSYPSLITLLQEHILMTPPMTKDELRLAIKEPAAQNGVIVETGLVERIISDCSEESGYLPLLQFTLDLLWQSEDWEDNRILTLKTYYQLGGIEGGLLMRLDRVFYSLNEREQRETKQIFLRLVNISNGYELTRRRAYLSEFTNLQGTIQKLIDQGLLIATSDFSSGKATIEVVDEAIIRSWQVLRNLIEENRELLIIRNRLSEDLERWINSAKTLDELLRGSRLEGALKLISQHNDFLPLSELEKEFINASLKLRDRMIKKELQRARALVIFPFISLAFGLVVGVIITLIWFSSEQNRKPKPYLSLTFEIDISLATQLAEVCPSNGKV